MGTDDRDEIQLEVGLDRLSKSTSKSYNGVNYLRLDEGETKIIRLLTQANEMVVIMTHFINTKAFKGNLLCLKRLGKPCPICALANKAFKSPFGVPVERFLALAIDRSDNDELKVLEGTRGLSVQLNNDYISNGSVTDVDYSYSKKKGSNDIINYTISALRNTVRQLNEEEKKLSKSIDLKKLGKDYYKSKEQLDKIIADFNSQGIAQPGSKDTDITKKKDSGDAKTEKAKTEDDLLNF